MISDSRFLYAFIGSHGITDMSLPYDLWVPTYLMSGFYAFLLPYRIMLSVTYGLSAIHFSFDSFSWIPLWARFLGYLSSLGILLVFRDKRWSQNTIMGYLGYVHTPIHLLRHLNHRNDMLVMLVFVCIAVNSHIQEYFHKIVHTDEILRDTFRNRALLSVLNSHILVSAMTSLTLYE